MIQPSPSHCSYHTTHTPHAVEADGPPDEVAKEVREEGKEAGPLQCELRESFFDCFENHCFTKRVISGCSFFVLGKRHLE